MKPFVLLLSLAFLATAPACKQKAGEVCQIDDDCEDNLVCNAATGRCQPPGQTGPDAAPQPDAMPGDDAGVDAPGNMDAGVDGS